MQCPHTSFAFTIHQSQDTNQFGSDWGESDPRRLADFLRALEKIEGLRWIRLLYCYPSYFSDDLVQEIASNSKASVVSFFCTYLLCVCRRGRRLAALPGVADV